MRDLIVIGAGPGGYEAAAHAGRMGRSVAVVEAGRLGGACLNVGCIPAKAFLRSSRLLRECREAEGFGVHSAGAALHMPSVVERKDRIVSHLAAGVRDLLERSGVEIIHGRARLAGHNRVRVGDEVHEADNVLIATGSRAARPPIAGIDSERVLTSDCVFDLAEVPRSVAVVGGGYVGLEMATFFREAGAAVTVLEMLPRIAAGCDADVSSRLLQALTQSGIVIQTGCTVLGVEDGAVRYRDREGEERTLAAERVVNAAGRTPAIEDLGLEEAGVDAGPRGIRTGCDGRTNVAGVWACGDVTGDPMLAHVATREGIVAVNAMFGTPDRVRRDALPAVIYTHPEVAMAGRTEEQLRSAGVAYRRALVPMGVAGRFLIENEHGRGFVKVLAGARRGEILGVHAMGDASSEFIVAAVVLIEAAVTARRAAAMVFPHPTVSEALRQALAQVAEECAR